MGTSYERIVGHAQVLAAFGYWPAFHDSEVRSLLLDRNAVLFEPIADARVDLCLHAFEWTHGAQPVFNHHLVNFRFHDVDELVLNDFNHQNAILEFRIEDHSRHADVPVGFKLTFLPAHGLSGSFCAASAEVASVIPCDEKGRPHRDTAPPDGDPPPPLGFVFR